MRDTRQCLHSHTHTHTHTQAQDWWQWCTDPASTGTCSTIAEEVEQNYHSCSTTHTLAQLSSAASRKHLIWTTQQIRALMHRWCKCTIQSQSEFPWDSFHGFKVDSNKRANPISMSESVREAVRPCRVCNEFQVWVGLSSPSRGLQGAPSPRYSATASLYIYIDYIDIDFQYISETMAQTQDVKGSAALIHFTPTYTYTHVHTHSLSHLCVNAYPVMKNTCTHRHLHIHMRSCFDLFQACLFSCFILNY